MNEKTKTSIDTRPKRNWRMILIEPFKQIKLGLYVIIICLIFLAAAAWTFYIAFHQQYQHVMNIFQIVDPTMQWELVNNDVFQTNALRLGALFLTFTVILCTIVFRMTHRIYGPLVSIERFVEQIARGEYQKRVTIRRGDELKRLADKLNVMAEELQKRHGPHFTRRAGDADPQSSPPEQLQP